MFLKLIGMGNLTDRLDDHRHHSQLTTDSDWHPQSNSESMEISRLKKQLQTAHHSNLRLASQLHYQKIFYQDEILKLNAKIQALTTDHQTELNLFGKEVKSYGSLGLKIN